jgi:hypothetical protein
MLNGENMPPKDDQPETATAAEPVSPAYSPVSPAVRLETGDVQTESRAIKASNNSATLLTLEDGTHFPPRRKKWLTAKEAERFTRLGVIVKHT